jgi:hypothetical protein
VRNGSDSFNLWGTRDPHAERDIDLALMTTNATRGVSHRFPFVEGVWGPLYFNEAEFAKLFPAREVRWLKEHSLTPNEQSLTRDEQIEDEDAEAEEEGIAAKREKLVVPPGFYRLPAAPDLPILMGARMSLSFPFLLSQVPLTDEFVKFVDGWGAETSDFGENSDKGRSPRPKPALPPGANDPRADGGV